jgi:hypothetical protein
VKYLCLIYGDLKKLGALTKEEMAALQKEGLPHFEELKKSGALVVATSGLGAEHKSIRPGADAPIVTDGPFVESKEQVGGLFIIEAPDLNEAVRVASFHPAARTGTAVNAGIEVRPIPYWAGK